MNGCNQTTDNSFAYLKGIHTLFLSECDQITGDGFSNLTGIHMLNMSYCKSQMMHFFIWLAFTHWVTQQVLTYDRELLSVEPSPKIFHCMDRILAFLSGMMEFMHEPCYFFRKSKIRVFQSNLMIFHC